MAATLQTNIQGLSPGLPGGVSAAYNVAAAGVLKGAAGILVSISVVAPGTSGNLTLNDSATTGGAASSNEICSIPFSALSASKILKFLWPCATGLTVSSVPTGFIGSIAFT